MTVAVSLIPQNRVENLITDLASKQSSSTAVTSVNNITPVNGNVSLTLPQVDQTYNSSSSNAQSGSAINGLDSTLVHKSGDETITGNKTFTAENNLTNLSADMSDTTNSYNIGIVHYRDKNGDSYFYTKAYQDTNRYMFEVAGNYGTDTWKNGLQVGYDRSNGNMFARIPSPATTDNSTQIATTAYVKSQGFLTTPNYSTQIGISLPYTAPANGFISGVLTAAHSENYYILVNNIQVQRIYGETNQRVTAPFFITVYKGDVITTTGGTNTVYFYYAR